MCCTERIHELVPPPLLTELHCRCSQDAIYTSERMADLYKRMEGTPLRNQIQDRSIQANGGDTPAQSDSKQIYTSAWRGHPCAIKLKTELYKRMEVTPLRNQTQDQFL